MRSFKPLQLSVIIFIKQSRETGGHRAVNRSPFKRAEVETGSRKKHTTWAF